MNAIYLAYILIVDEHLGIVVPLVQRQYTWGADLRQFGDVDDRAPTLVQFLHRAQRTIHHQGVTTHHDIGMISELELRDGDKRGWHLGDGRQLGLAVLLHHLT